MRLVGVYLSDWEFKELLRADFFAKPLTSVRLPGWNLCKVLELLRGHPRIHLEFLERTLLLTALASGNRVAEQAALRPDTVRFTEEGVFLAVQP